MTKEEIKIKAKEYFLRNHSNYDSYFDSEKLSEFMSGVNYALNQAEKLPIHPVSGSLLLHDLFQVAAITNEDGMPVITYVDKPNGGSVAYVRHDAMVKKLNNLLKL